MLKVDNKEEVVECKGFEVEGFHYVLEHGVILSDDSACWADPKFVESPVKLPFWAIARHDFAKAMARPGEPAWIAREENADELYKVFKSDPVKFGDNTLVELELEAIERTRRLVSKVSRLNLNLADALERVRVREGVEEVEISVRSDDPTSDRIARNEGASKVHRIKKNFL